ncbi:tRNA (adenosine(37)-N6)-dimethylallyltransferase MiaA [Candidatus Omnitrophota bacterium]
MSIVICLLGPTAVGKTEVALQLAKKLDAEIISCDSMQVYQGANIATCKPSKSQRKGIPHHLIDIVKPSGEYNAARFKAAAEEIIAKIHKRKKIPLIVAGTGLYLKALLDGLFVGPGQSKPLRQEFYQLAKKYGSAYLYQRLKRNDPEAAANIHPHDLRRIVRALEVYQLSGQPISKLQKSLTGIKDKYAVSTFGLIRPRQELYARIDKRVEWMFSRGLVAEIKKLSKLRLSKTAKSLLGYKEVLDLLKGKCSRDQAKELLKKNTRRYAKRQLTWFRKQKNVHWIEIGSGDSPAAVAKRINSNVGDWKE